MSTRYHFGGDEHIFVEVDEEMSLEAFFTSLSMTNAVRDSADQGRDRDLPGQRLASRSSSIRTGSSPTTCWRELQVARRSAAESPTPSLQDPDHRDPGLLQRSLDPRDADAVSRTPSGPERAPISNTPREINDYKSVDDVHRRPFRRALVRLHGRLRRRPAVPLPDGRTASGRSRCRNTCARAPTRRS